MTSLLFNVLLIALATFAAADNCGGTQKFPCGFNNPNYSLEECDISVFNATRTFTCTDLPKSVYIEALTQFGPGYDQCTKTNIVTSPTLTPISDFNCLKVNGIYCANKNFTSPDPVYQISFIITSTNLIENCKVNASFSVVNPLSP